MSTDSASGLDLEMKQEQTQAFALLRRESLDLYNRLHSITEDISFVNQIHEAYPELPILPNLRCGAWYVDPQIAVKEPAYFKSTDGHFGNWSFNLRRPNLHLLSAIIEHHGMIIVDSTRAGKRIPDALSKTVPIWCAVINRAVALSNPEHSNIADWDTKLYTPPASVSVQEHRQIEDRIDTWAQTLISSSYNLPRLSRPLRPIWITPATSAHPILTHSEDGRSFFPIICVSASKQVSCGIERRTGGFAYVQGSGDDHELWANGLTPLIFWEHQHELLDCSRSELPAFVNSLVENSHTKRAQHTVWNSLPTPITAVSGVIFLAKVSDLPTPLPGSLPGLEGTKGFAQIAYVLVTSIDEPTHTKTPHNSSDGEVSGGPRILRIEAPEGKRGQKYFLNEVLPQSIAFIRGCLLKRMTICVACDSGTDTSVGIALAVLSKFFDDNGSLAIDDAVSNPIPDKKSIRTRLQWIIASYPRANPSRTTLKRVNEFLLSPLSFRSKA